MKRLTLFVTLFLAAPMPALADFQNGFRAYSADDYATALLEWKPLAEQGDAMQLAATCIIAGKEISGIPRLLQNPKILMGDDAEVV